MDAATGAGVLAGGGTVGAATGAMPVGAHRVHGQDRPAAGRIRESLTGGVLVCYIMPVICLLCARRVAITCA